VQRTQIYLDDEESTLLAEASERTGASRSELIRRAVRAQYGTTSEGRLAALRATAGIWRDRQGPGSDYVDELREDLGERLDRVGLA
jgi:hypothetical protein